MSCRFVLAATLFAASAGGFAPTRSAAQLGDVEQSPPSICSCSSRVDQITRCLADRNEGVDAERLVWQIFGKGGIDLSFLPAAPARWKEFHYRRQIGIGPMCLASADSYRHLASGDRNRP